MVKIRPDYVAPDYVLFNESQLSVMSRITEIKFNKRNEYKIFELVVMLTHGVGGLFLVLEAYFFGTLQGGFTWKTADYIEEHATSNKVSNGLVNFHGFFMTSAFIFFQGEALIAYRVFRHEMKGFSKTIHVLLHLAALTSAGVGLAAMVRHKNSNPFDTYQMYSFHSWLGILVIASYIIQFFFGFINFTYPQTYLEIRQRFLPFHRLAGNIIFIAAATTALIGHQRYACFAFDYSDIEHPGLLFPGCDRTHTCVKNLDLVLNFSTFFLIIYVLLICLIIRVDGWRRIPTKDEKEESEKID